MMHRIEIKEVIFHFCYIYAMMKKTKKGEMNVNMSDDLSNKWMSVKDEWEANGMTEKEFRIMMREDQKSSKMAEERDRREEADRQAAVLRLESRVTNRIHRMNDREELYILFQVACGFFVQSISDCLAFGNPREWDTFPEFVASKTPFNVKRTWEAVVYHLGWDSERCMTHSAATKAVEEEALRLLDLFKEEVAKGEKGMFWLQLEHLEMLTTKMKECEIF